ncbi:beta-lactamase-like protein [Podospora aff. communis PSN243]|uniref:Beta-lactamase-like protein n=1 Tax=Podospora aff. communis PSN243 TaxID=3040156 RepID=A0AAV9G2C0_9PEZI|nr:beta-lactamase-like protein [Podospora aff. communis PSN243]
MASLTPQLVSQWPAATARALTELAPVLGAGVGRCLSSRCRVRAQPLQGTQSHAVASTRAIHHQYCRRAQATRTTRGAISLSPPNHYPMQIPPLGAQNYTTIPTPTTEPDITPVFEPVTGTWQYLIADPSTLTAAIVDPVLDYHPPTRSITTATADALLDLIKSKSYTITWILETHAHADHLTAASYLRKRLAESQPHPPTIGIGSRIPQIQSLFGRRYSLPESEYTPLVFDHLFSDDEVFPISETLSAKALHLPGHTPDHMGYQIGDNVFCGDSLFNADIGTARCDFPGGDATQLYASARRLLALPENVKIWTGHDYPDGTREPQPYMTVAEHRRLNRHVRDGIAEGEFVKMRGERDRGLAAPRLLHQSLQMNVRGGKLPRKTEFGDRLWHLPVKVEKEW